MQFLNLLNTSQEIFSNFIEQYGIGVVILFACSVGIDLVYAVVCRPIFRIFSNFTYRKVAKIRIYITYPTIFLTAILDIFLFKDFLSCLFYLIEVWSFKGFSIPSHIHDVTLKEPYGIFSFNFKIAKKESEAFQSLNEFEMEEYLERYYENCEKLPTRTKILLTQAVAWGLGSLIGCGLNLIF